MTQREQSNDRLCRSLRHRSANRQLFARELISLAHLVGAPIIGSDGKRLGRVEDVIARWQDGADRPVVAGILAKVGKGTVVLNMADTVLSQSMVKVGAGSTNPVAKGFDDESLVLARDVMDHQIVDMDGVQVVRSSDVYLAARAGGWEVGAIDVGMWSLARRLLPRRRSCPAPNRAVDWVDIQPFARRPASDGQSSTTAASVRLAHHAERLRTLRAGEVADLLADLDRSNQAQLVALTSRPSAAEALKELEPSKLRALLAELDEGDREHLTAMLPADTRSALGDGDD